MITNENDIDKLRKELKNNNYILEYNECLRCKIDELNMLRRERDIVFAKTSEENKCDKYRRILSDKVINVTKQFDYYLCQDMKKYDYIKFTPDDVILEKIEKWKKFSPKNDLIKYYSEIVKNELNAIVNGKIYPDNIILVCRKLSDLSALVYYLFDTYPKIDKKMLTILSINKRISNNIKLESDQIIKRINHHDLLLEFEEIIYNCALESDSDEYKKELKELYNHLGIKISEIQKSIINFNTMDCKKDDIFNFDIIKEIQDVFNFEFKNFQILDDELKIKNNKKKENYLGFNGIERSARNLLFYKLKDVYPLDYQKKVRVIMNDFVHNGYIYHEKINGNLSIKILNYTLDVIELVLGENNEK